MELYLLYSINNPSPKLPDDIISEIASYLYREYAVRDLNKSRTDKNKRGITDIVQKGYWYNCSRILLDFEKKRGNPDSLLVEIFIPEKMPETRPLINGIENIMNKYGLELNYDGKRPIY